MIIDAKLSSNEPGNETFDLPSSELFPGLFSYYLLSPDFFLIGLFDPSTYRRVEHPLHFWLCGQYFFGVVS
jgi:hypothetical protein